MRRRSRTTLVTVSYGPDAERCRYLCASVERYLPPEVPHLLIVPKKDLKLFTELKTARTRILATESIVPGHVMQLPFQDRWWLSPYSIPIRGWIMQQITKISAVFAVDTESMLFIDSDAVFIKSFDPDSLLKEGKVRLFRQAGAGNRPTQSKWHISAARLLGIEKKPYYGSDYISQLISWHSDTVRLLISRIKGAHKIPWQVMLYNSLHFSEYILYGIFVEHVLKGSNHYYDETNLCLCSWSNSAEAKTNTEKFFLENLQPHHVAILMQSTLGMSPEEYANDIEKHLSTSTTSKA